MYYKWALSIEEHVFFLHYGFSFLFIPIHRYYQLSCFLEEVPIKFTKWFYWLILKTGVSKIREKNIACFFRNFCRKFVFQHVVLKIVQFCWIYTYGFPKFWKFPHSSLKYILLEAKKFQKNILSILITKDRHFENSQKPDAELAISCL